MAIHQISKIQLRRGRKGLNDIPQLASGELSWSIDTQELFIGNGSVAEGAPFVGNTRIITEHDNIFALAGSYSYDSENININTGPTSLSLQTRLDEYVSVKEFGALGDGSSDDTIAIQRALDQLYINPATVGSPASRKLLFFPAGDYVISEALAIPPYANLKGSGIDKTIITQVGLFPIFYTVGQDSIPGTYTDLASMTTSTQPTTISIDGFTFQHTQSDQPIGLLYATINSILQNIKFVGTWDNSTIYSSENALELYAKTSEITCKNNLFNNCIFTNVSYGIRSTYDINSNTFTNCHFNMCGYGVILGDSVDSTVGQQVGPVSTLFNSCSFTDIEFQAIFVVNGFNNISQTNRFVNVGNVAGIATYPVIDYQSGGNISQLDYFDRFVEYSVDPTNIYISEYNGHVLSTFKSTTPLILDYQVSPATLLRLGAYGNVTYKIHYHYTSAVADVTRSGTLTVMIHKISNTINVSDDYNVVGTLANQLNLELDGQLINAGADTDYQTVRLTYTNLTTADYGFFTYWIEVIS